VGGVGGRLRRRTAKPQLEPPDAVLPNLRIVCIPRHVLSAIFRSAGQTIHAFVRCEMKIWPKAVVCGSKSCGRVAVRKFGPLPSACKPDSLELPRRHAWARPACVPARLPIGALAGGLAVITFF
jgi:hypothetical protein